MSNIVYWVADGTACGYYRCRQPGAALQAKGHTVIASEVVDLNPLPERGAINTDHLRSCDVLVGQRIGKPGPSKLWQSMARTKSRTHSMIYELDDDVFALCEEPTNPNHVVWPDLIVDVVKNLACSDAVTVSTAPLAEVVSRFTSAPVHVVPNAIGEHLIDPQWNALPDTCADSLGWSGSPTHDGDWAYNGHARSVARWIRKRGIPAGWRLTTIGHPPRPVVNAFTWMSPGPNAPWHTVPGEPDIENYYAMVRAHFDVGLAPLAPSRFNASKSDLRLLELAALGIPWVASDVGPYACPDHTSAEARGGARVSRPRDWWDALNRITGDAALRAVLRVEGQAWARTRTVDRVLPLWESALGLPNSSEQPREGRPHDQDPVS